MATPLAIYNTQDLIYGYMLSARYASPWVYEPSNASLSEPDLWEVLRNDDDVVTSLETRRSNLIRPWNVRPNPHVGSKGVDKSVAESSRKLAAITAEALSGISRFDAARRLLSDAYVIGRRYAEIVYEEQRISLDGSPELDWLIPVALKDVDRRRFHWVTDWSEGKGVRTKRGVHLEMFDTNLHQWVEMSPDIRRRYIEYVWEDTEDRLGYGRGVQEAMFYTHYFKTGSLKKLMEGLDRFANGILKGRLDSLRAASPDIDNFSLANNMKATLQKMRTEHVIVLQDNDDVEVLDAPGTGMSINMEAIRYFAEKVFRLLNGSVRQAGHSVDGTGSMAAAGVESDTAESFYQFPREDLDEVINRDLVGSFIYFNAGNFQSLGLANGRKPKFSTEQVKRQNPLERVQVLNQSKVPISVSHYYEAIDAPVPEPDEDVVEAASPEAPGFGFGPKETDEKGKPSKVGKEVAMMSADDVEDVVRRMIPSTPPANFTINIPEKVEHEVRHLVTHDLKDMPAPVVNVTLPKSDPVVVNYTPPEIVMPDIKFEPVINYTPPPPPVIPKAKKNERIEFEMDERGRITGAHIKSS